MMVDEEKLFREWLSEQTAHARIIDDNKEIHGDYKVILVERCTEPYGTWKQNGWKTGQQKLMEQAQGAAKTETKPPTAQSSQTRPKTDSVMDVIKGKEGVEIEGDKVVLKKTLDKREFFDLKDELTKRGWKYVAPRHIGGEKWEPGYFEMEGAKA